MPNIPPKQLTPGAIRGDVLIWDGTNWSYGPPGTNFVYPTAVERMGDTGFLDRDIGKVAYQQDNNTTWVLVDTTPTWGQLPVVSVTPPTWHTLIQVDFSAAPTGDFAGNGSVVIGGKTFVVENFGNLHTGATMGIVNGSGLKLGCQGVGRSYPLLRDTPLLRWSFGNSVITNKTPIRTCVYTGTAEGSTGNTYLAIEYPDSSSRNSHWVKGVVAPAATVFSAYDLGFCVNSNSTTISSGASLPTNTNLLSIMAPEGVEASLSPKVMPKVLSGILANGDFSDVNQQNVINNSIGSIAYGTIYVPETAQQASWGVALSSSFSSQNSSYKVYVRSLKVEAFY